jgi:hypothetical protein
MRNKQSEYIQQTTATACALESCKQNRVLEREICLLSAKGSTSSSSPPAFYLEMRYDNEKSLILPRASGRRPKAEKVPTRVQCAGTHCHHGRLTLLRWSRRRRLWPRGSAATVRLCRIFANEVSSRTGSVHAKKDTKRKLAMGYQHQGAQGPKE